MTSDRGAATTATRAWSRVRNSSALERLALLRFTPFALAVAYGVALLVTLRSVIQGIYASADVAALPVIGDLIGHAPHGAVVTLGNIPWYSAVWFEELTRSLPGHRALWEVAAWVLGLIGIALTAGATARVAGRWAGAIVAVTCACAGTGLLSEQMAWSVHAVTYFHVCVLGAFTVPLARSDRWIGGRVTTHTVLVVLVGALAGLGVACDKLVIVAGLLPFVVAGLVLTALAQRRWMARSASVVAVTVVAIATAVLVTQIAEAQHLKPSGFPIRFVDANQLLNHVGDMIGSLTVLDNGSFSGAAPSFTSVVALLTAIVVLVGIYGAVRVAQATIAEWRAPAGWRAAGEGPAARARTVFLVFWIASTVSACVAFAATSIPIGFTTSRYLVTAGYGLVVILAAGTARDSRFGRRMLLTVGASLLIFSSLVGVVQGQSENSLIRPQANAVASFARATGVNVAYAGYWDSLSLTWATYGAVHVYPLTLCPIGFCPFGYNQIKSWYRPRPGIRSMLIIDPARIAINGLSQPAGNLGSPIASETAAGLQLYVYGYDIAARLGPR